MIKIEKFSTYGWEEAIRGMRNPMNSWDKSDSRFNFIETHVDELGEFDLKNGVELGENDLALMKRLRKAGTDHRKYLRFIDVYVDINAPLYWWKEFKTYRKDRKFLDEENFYDYDDYDIEEFIEMNSCSTIHKIHSKEFTLDDFSWDHLINLGPMADSFSSLHHTISTLNFWRNRFIETDEERKKYFNYNGYPGVPTKKECWWQMIQLLPSSYNQRRTVKLTYEVLNRMYHSRKNHKLDEWRDFCKWIESLPYAKELITDGEDI